MRGPFWSYRVYGRSKLANIYFTRALAKRLEGTGVTVNAVHPGSVATRFGRDGDTRLTTALTTFVARPFSRTPEEGARTQVWWLAPPSLEGVSGHLLQQLQAGGQEPLEGRPGRRGRRAPLDRQPRAPRLAPVTTLGLLSAG